jgi:hypothetical protein
MTVARSIETRLMEGLRRDFLADADVLSYFTGGVDIGPLIDVNPKLSPPQIQLATMASDAYENGTGGISKDRVPILVKVFFPVNSQKSFTVGDLNPHDYVRHLENIVANGSIDPAALPLARNGRGWVLDPYWSGSATDPLRWLNTAFYGVTRGEARVLPNNAALLIAFAVDYETRVNNLTREREN